MGAEINISLCMIVKNEEKNLTRCLESIHKGVDEIIIVDTGSSDETREIAEKYGALIIDIDWDDDFSKARNESLKYAEGEWIIYLDADEELPKNTVDKLKDLSRDKDVTAWLFSIISPINGSSEGPINKHSNIRMFRNKKNYSFEGCVHEQVKPSILRTDPEAVIKDSGLIIKHHGYRQDRPGRRKKTLRNIRLLKKELATDPRNSFLNYNLGISYYMLKELKVSCNYYKKSLENVDHSLGYAPVLYRNYCVCLIETGEFSRAIKIVNEGLAYYPDYPDLYFLKGEIFWEVGLLNEAENCFLRCIQFKKSPVEYTTTAGVNSYMALENLAEVYAGKGNYKQALKYINQVLEEICSERVLLKLVSYLEKNGYQELEILKYLQTNFRLEPEVLVKILFNFGKFGACIDYIEQNEDNSDLLFYRARSMMFKGDFSGAEEVFRLVLEDDYSGEILKNICLCRWLNRPRKTAYEFLSNFSPNSTGIESKNPVLVACDFINELIFTEEKVKKGLNNKVKQNLEEILIGILKLGDVDLALYINKYIYESLQNDADRYLNLGRLAVKNNMFSVGEKLLVRSLHKDEFLDEICYLAGRSCSMLNKFEKAFHYYLKASRINPQNELYATCALRELLNKILVLIKSSEGDKNTGVKKYLIELTSFRKKIEGITRRGIDGKCYR